MTGQRNPSKWALRARWAIFPLTVMVASVLAACALHLTPYDSHNPITQLSTVGLTFVSVLVIPLIWLDLNTFEKILSTLLAVATAALPLFFVANPPAQEILAGNSLEALGVAINATSGWFVEHYVNSETVFFFLLCIAGAVLIAAIGALISLARG